MKTNTIYTLVIDGKEVAKSTLLSNVAIKTDKVTDHYEIRKYQKGKIAKIWGYSVRDGKKIGYHSHDTDTQTKTKIKKSMLKISDFSNRVCNVLSTIKSEYKIRRNLKSLEKRVELLDL
jgi:uncharacterized Fe-S radical SAM superfamily protein PflX